jgi:hypothetical protein
LAACRPQRRAPARGSGFAPHGGARARAAILVTLPYFAAARSLLAATDALAILPAGVVDGGAFDPRLATARAPTELGGSSNGRCGTIAHIATLPFTGWWACWRIIAAGHPHSPATNPRSKAANNTYSPGIFSFRTGLCHPPDWG